jgi:hypothetical protein
MDKPRYSWRDLVFLLIVGVASYFIIQNKTAVQDWWYFRSYQPPQAIIELADRGGMSAYGRKLFYRTNPQLVEQTVIDSECAQENLGCITETGQVYILNDPAHGNDMVVTAAHEMLHVAYLRLAKAERQKLNQYLTSQQAALSDPTLNNKIAGIGDPEERLDELHSYLGTEHGGLSAELERHYSLYFDDRAKVVEAYRRR